MRTKLSNMHVYVFCGDRSPDQRPMVARPVVRLSVDGRPMILMWMRIVARFERVKLCKSADQCSKFWSPDELGNIYWSNVLTERFSIPYKNQTKKIQVTRFQVWYKSRYPLLLSQKYRLGDKNHSTVTGFFKSSKSWLKEFSWCKGFLFASSIVLTCFQFEKSQNKLDLIQNFLLKRFTKLVMMNIWGSEAKTSHRSNFPFLFYLNLYQNTI